MGLFSQPKNKVVEWFIRHFLDGESKKGTIVGKIWSWFDGKKTIVGGVITIVAYLVAGIPTVAALCTTATCVANVAKAAGIGLTVVGLLHKAYKFLYREEHP